MGVAAAGAIIVSIVFAPTIHKGMVAGTATDHSISLHESHSKLGAMFKVMAEVVEGIHDVTEVSDAVGVSYDDINKIFDEMNVSIHTVENVADKVVHRLDRPMKLSMELKQKLHNLTVAQKEKIKEKLLAKLNISSLHDLVPDEDRSDGNTCEDDEELYDQLCYKKCSLLTGSKMPIRSSAFQCCGEEPPCPASSDLSALHPCSGNDVSGDLAGNGCPHAPGGCLKDEELFDGLCYMRCSLLTNGMLQYRDTADACCKSNSPFAVLEPGECDTDPNYNMGGGEGDGNPFTPSSVHPPLTSITETAP
jgi:hypothetical protein